MADDGEAAPNGIPTVSVVMPTYNRSTALARTLEPLLADDATLEVIVVDDGSSDGTRRVLEQLASSSHRLRWISIDNGGAARARQLGVEAARGDVVLVMDDDVVASPGLVAGHARLHRDGVADIVVGYMPTDLPPAGSRGTFATTIYANSYAEHCLEWEANPSGILRRLWMGNISLRRVHALRVGMYGTVSGYHADRDFGLRCAQAGLTAIFDRRLASSHRHQRRLHQFRADARSQGASAFALSVAHGNSLGGTDLGSAGGTGLINRLAIAAGRRRPLGCLLAGAVAMGVRLAGWSRATTIELRGAYLLTRIEAARGYDRASRAAAVLPGSRLR